MFFDNSLLKDHTGYILEIIVVFLQSARFEKNKALGFFCCCAFGFEQNCDQYLPSNKKEKKKRKKLFKSYLISGNLT